MDTTEKSLPLVSVILTSYNQKSLLERAFISLLKQSHAPIEIIIVDDFSTDGSRDWIQVQALTYPEKVKYFLQPANSGIPVNKNTGFKMATGDFITYLDGDDTYYPEKIKKEIEIFTLHPEYGVVYSNFDFKEYNSTLIKIWAEGPLPEGDIFNDIALSLFPHNHLHRFEMFRKEVMHILNFYDETFSVFHDLDFMLRYAARYKVGYTLNLGSSYFMNPNSIVSGTKSWNMTEQHRKVFLKLKPLFMEKGLQATYDAYLKESEIKLLYGPPQIHIINYFSALLSQPGRFAEIIKALYYSIRFTK